MGGFVGRRAELATALDLLDDLEAGRPGWLSVVGEPGIGKTRLLAEVATAADDRGCLVLGGRGAEFEREIPFGVWIDALDDCLAGLGDDALAGLVGGQASWLRGMFPALMDAGAAPVLGGPSERYLAHRAVRALLEALGARCPVAIVIDDLHWADPASAELLAHLLRRPPTGPVLVAVGLRTGRGPAGLIAELEAAIRCGNGAELRLTPFGAAEAEELIGAAVLDPRRRATVIEQSGGNPFYLEALARADAHGAVPPSVAAALAQELDALPVGSRLLVEGAAVAGDPVDLDEAGRAASMTEPEVLAAIDVLLSADLLRCHAVPRRYLFRHPIVRRAVYQAIPESRRIAAHARLAAALAGASSDLGARAHHLERSAQAGDLEAVGVLVDAGAAVASTAPAAAARWYEAALRLLPADAVDRRLAVIGALAAALSGQGRLSEARARLCEAIELVPAPGRARTRLVSACAAIEHWTGQHAAAERRLRAAVAELPDVATADAASLYVELATSSVHQAEFEQAANWAERAYHVATRVGEPALAAAAMSINAVALSVSFRRIGAEHAIERATAMVDGLPDAEAASRMDALFFLGNAAHLGEHYADAVRHFRRGIALSRSTRRDQFLFQMLAGISSSADALGDLATAAEHADLAVEVARMSGPTQMLAWPICLQAWTAANRGDMRTAMELGERLVTFLDPSDPGLISTFMRAQFAVMCLLAGDPERCVAQMTAAGAPDFPRAAADRRTVWLATLASAELALGNRSEAEGWLQRAQAAAAACGLPVSGGTVLRTHAEFLLRDGHPAEAADVASRAAALACSRGARIESARSRLLAGRALARAGERDRAVTELATAESELAECGAHGFARRATAALRRLGVRTAGAAGPTEQLTERERQVALLVADGRTNRQVARALGLSEKTVEGHLRRIFTKLAVTSRAAVAAAVTRSEAS